MSRRLIQCWCFAERRPRTFCASSFMQVVTKNIFIFLVAELPPEFVVKV